MLRCKAKAGYDKAEKQRIRSVVGASKEYDMSADVLAKALKESFVKERDLSFQRHKDVAHGVITKHLMDRLNIPTDQKVEQPITLLFIGINFLRGNATKGIHFSQKKKDRFKNADDEVPTDKSASASVHSNAVESSKVIDETVVDEMKARPLMWNHSILDLLSYWRTRPFLLVKVVDEKYSSKVSAYGCGCVY